jgi:two-component system nitrate/nitrite response regulator NarL
MRLIIVDDHSLFRGALVYLFHSQPGFEVVGEASTIKEALALVDVQHPDLIIMDVGLPDGSGIDTISKILQKIPDVNIVLLTIHASDESAFTAIRLGAKGFLLKDISAPALLTALHGLSKGELAVSRAVLSRYVTELRPLFMPRGGDGSGSETTLTFREIELLAELSSGDSNSEIARRLSISENTVKIHVHNILHKLKLQSRQEAATYARRHGLVTDFAKQLKMDSKTETEVL